MRDLTRMLIVLALATPAACHDDRDAVAPTEPGPAGPASAGKQLGPPAPAITNEPTVPGVPNASEGLAPTFGASPLASRDAPAAFEPGTLGERAMGSGGTLGQGGAAGMPGYGGSGAHPHPIGR